MPNMYSIVVVSKAEGDYETEDRMMQEIHDFAMKLRRDNLDRATVGVRTEYGVDPNNLVAAVPTGPEKESQSNEIRLG